jgi:protein gp37
MGENSKIEWCDHTANFWWGCVKVSPLCDNCYAESMTNRYGGDFTNRRRFIKSVWTDCLKWDAQARKDQVRRRVFCMSMGDLFEQLPDGHPDKTELDHKRMHAFEMMDTCDALEWLLLTKRISNVEKMVPRRWREKQWPGHVRLGISVGTQKDADRDIPRLIALKVPNFVSMEPLLEQVNLFGEAFTDGDTYGPAVKVTGYPCNGPFDPEEWDTDVEPGIDWVITGGESGPGARPSHPTWFRSLRDECEIAEVPFLFKQWGEWISTDQKQADGTYVGFNQAAEAIFGKVAPRHKWPDNLNSYRIRKKNAGRLLDGRTHDAYPQVTL